MRVEDSFNFIQEYNALCRKYGMVVVKCACEECETYFPYDCTEDDDLDLIEEMNTDMIEWFVEQRQNFEMEN